jgi:hypothetical protein
MNFWGLLFLVIAQFIAGRGLLAILNVRLKPVPAIAVSQLTGVMLVSLIPMIIQLFYIPITTTSILISISVIALVLGLLPLKRYDFSIFKLQDIRLPRPAIYELLFVLLLTVLMIPSLWRSYYYPPNARDVLSGPEALAKYAVEEQKLNNSVFTVNLLESTPNLQKPPFVTDLQIVYKLLVHPFGQLWLPIIVVCFMVWLYTLLRERLHPLLAGMALLLFLSIPEVYGYTYIILWDYANMVYFFAGFYFLYQYITGSPFNWFLASCIMFGFSTFIRLETLIFIGMLLPLPVYYMWKNKVKIPRIVFSSFLFLAIPYSFYFIWTKIFVPYYFPPELAIKESMNFSPALSYFEWFSQINATLVFGGINIALYGLYIYAFIVVVVLDLIVFRKITKEGRYFLYGIAVIYFGMPLLTYLTDWFNITTAKRGLFKMFPLMLLYISHSGIITRLSQAITAFEHPVVAQKAQKAEARVQAGQPKNKKKKR